MNGSHLNVARAAMALIALLAMALAHPARAGQARMWVAAWGAAPDSEGPALHDQTVRQALRISIGGGRLRVCLSNAYGKAPLQLGAVHLARSTGGGSIDPATDRTLLFSKRQQLTLAPGQEMISDALDFAVTPLDELAVSIYVKTSDGRSTVHSDARHDSYIDQHGDVTSSPGLPNATTDASRYFLSEVLVEAAPGARAFVIVGDSISDGDASTRNQNARWPDVLAARLQAAPQLASVAVVNSGISGNRLLEAGPVGPSMLQRFERDALAKPGVHWILLEAGLNDIGLSGEGPGKTVPAGRVIDGLKQLVQRAHSRGIEVWGATVTPYGGAEQPLRHNAAAEAKRLAINAWIRSAGNLDRVIDFDAAIRDPQQPARILPSLDSGDHVHPNDAGYRALAAAVPLQFFNAR